MRKALSRLLELLSQSYAISINENSPSQNRQFPPLLSQLNNHELQGDFL